MASTWELQAALTKGLAIQAAQPKKPIHMCHLTPAVKREVKWWKWILRVNLERETLCTEAWYLAKTHGDREQIELFTDASTTIGGGYIWHGNSYGSIKWSQTEKDSFGANSKTIDINGLEFITAICAIIAERDQLKGKTALLRVDNTAAVSWLNKARTSQIWGQEWLRVLVAVLLEYNILLTSTHISGETNIFADQLSRDIQTPQLTQELKGLKRMRLLSAGSREKIWTKPSTEYSPKEYVRELKKLETWDTVHLNKSVKINSTGNTHT